MKSAERTTPGGSARRSGALAIGLTLVGVLALIAVLGLLAGCAHQTTGVASVGTNTGPATAPGSPATSPATARSTAARATPSPAPVTVTAAPVTTTVPPSTVTATATSVLAVPVPVNPAPAGRLPGDLGLAQPISSPSCDGLGILVLKSATTPGAYAAEVADALAATPGSSYLRTDVTCPSLTPATPSGDPIYAVYVPAGYSRTDVCRALEDAPSGAYGRWLSWTVSPDHTIDC